MKNFRSRKSSKSLEKEEIIEVYSPKKISRSLLKSPNFKSIFKKTEPKWKTWLKVKKHGISMDCWIRNLDEENITQIWHDLLLEFKVHQQKTTNKLDIMIGNLLLACQITDKCVERITSGISQHFPGLQILEITFSNSPNITNKSLAVIGSNILRTLVNLKRLKLGFEMYWCIFILMTYAESTRCGFQDLWILGKEMKNLVTLQELVLVFYKCSLKKSQDITMLLSPIGRYNQNIRLLCLNFSRSFLIDDQTLEIIGSELSLYLVNLNHFSIDISFCCKITDQGLEQFASKIIKRRVGLEKLTIILE